MITMKEIAEKVARKPKIGFTCGTFDLTHAGHYLMFQDCKRYCDYLIVGVQSDPHIDRPNKNQPIQSVNERILQVEACKWVNITFRYDTEAQLYEYLQKNNDGIGVRFVGADWREKSFTGHDLPIEVMFNSRDHEYSSSNLRRRVIMAGNGL